MEPVAGIALVNQSFTAGCRIQISAVLTSKQYVYSAAYPTEARKGNTRIRVRHSGHVLQCNFVNWPPLPT